MNLYQKYKGIRKENLILSYSGLLSNEVIAQLMRLAEATLVTHSVHTRQKRSIVNILIEALQNIHYHGDCNLSEVNSDYRDCLLMLGRVDDTYFINTGNFIKNELVSDLKDKLQKLPPLTIEELNNIYLKTLEKVTVSAKGGAGLGLIKIFIDSKKQTSYSFEKINDSYSFFTMKINVS